jgi:hypothetical protein
MIDKLSWMGVPEVIPFVMAASLRFDLSVVKVRVAPVLMF